MSRSRVWSVAIGMVLAMPGLCRAQVGGNLAAYPAVDIDLEIVSGANGPILSDTLFTLVTGEYYRVNVTSDGNPDWRFEAADLLQNSHLRLVTIDGIEVHLQGLTFRAIELDEPGTASFSFTPIRPGTYFFSVGDVPSALGRPIGAAGLDPDGRAAVGRFVVE